MEMNLPLPLMKDGVEFPHHSMALSRLGSTIQDVL
jgi:hypothetical protein